MSFLLGVPGRLKTLIDRLTSTRAGYLDNLASYTPARGTKLDNLDALITSRASGADYTPTRAGKLDNLDATVASRAPASTALSTSTWTSARAAKLDNLDATISGISAVQSIQTDYLSAIGAAGSGEDGAFRNVTISSVNTSKSIVLIHNDQFCSTGRLTSSTNLRISFPGGGSPSMRCRWWVIEFK